jgi:hypothetical protein
VRIEAAFMIWPSWVTTSECGTVTARSSKPTSPLPANEWPMVDIETGVSDPAIFLLRWLGHYEYRQQRGAAIALHPANTPIVSENPNGARLRSKSPFHYVG